MEYKSNILENLRPDYIQLGTALYLDKLTNNVSIGEIQGLTFTSRFMVKSTDSTANQIVLQHSGNGVAIAGIGQESSHGSLQLRLNSGITQVRLSAINSNYIMPSLGIGVTSLSAKLQVDKDNANSSVVISRSGSNIPASTGVGSITFASHYNSAYTDYAGINAYSNNLSSLRCSLDFKVKSTSGTLLTGMTLYGTSSGVNVGIGTITPQKTLHIEGASGASASQLLVTGASDTDEHTAGILLRAEAGEADSALRAKGGIFFERVAQASSYGLGKMHLAVNGSANNDSATVANSVITILGSGNVGIGTPVPYAKTQINGTTPTGTTGYGDAANSGQLYLTSNAVVGSQLGGRIAFGGIAGNGGGAFSGTRQDSVYGTIEGYKFNATANNSGGGLTFKTNFNNTGVLTERMNITQDGKVIIPGKVGIGNTDPLFQVQTNAIITGGWLGYLNGTSATFGTNNFSAVHSSTAIGTGTESGINLANNASDDGAPSPIISFSAKSASTTYQHAYAAIYGIKTATGADTNWNKGDLVLATGQSTGPIERVRINSVGAVKFNNYGAGILVTDASGNITATTSPPVDGITFNNGATITNQINTDVDTGTETIANVAIATHDSAFFDFVIKKTTNVRSGTVYACHDGTSVVFTETSTNDLGDTSDVTLSVDISGTNMRLLATVTSDDWSVKSLIRAI